MRIDGAFRPLTCLCSSLKTAIGSLSSPTKSYLLKQIAKSTAVGSVTMPLYVISMDQISSSTLFSGACMSLTGFLNPSPNGPHQNDHFLNHHMLAGAMIGGTASLIAQKISEYSYFKKREKISHITAGCAASVTLLICNIAYHALTKLEWDASLETFGSIALISTIGLTLAPVGIFSASQTSVRTQDYNLPV